MKLSITGASEDDIPGLFIMNKQLMEDEEFDRPLNDENLRKRWEEFLTQNKYQVLLFILEDDIIGYAVVHMDQSPLYLRHFFIKREFRRMGNGSNCFHEMLNHLNTSTIDLDVMSWNERGFKFWKSLGFTERCKIMTFVK
jgi:ribosomal protein S18 acetylase RimI-like enzyme